MPHHQVWKQKGEEYRLFGGGGWVWTSGLQCRKRKRPQGEKDTFRNKKRKLLDTTNKIVSLKEKERAEALKKEADKGTKIAAQQASSQSTSLAREKSTLSPQGVQTSSATTASVTAITKAQNTLTAQTVSLSTSLTLQNTSVTASISSSVLTTVSSKPKSTMTSTSSSSRSGPLMTTAAASSTTSSLATHLQSSASLPVFSIATTTSPALTGIPSVVSASSSLVSSTDQSLSSVPQSVITEPSSHSRTVQPVLSSQAQSPSSNSLSSTVLSTLQMTTSNKTTLSVSEASSITTSKSTQLLLATQTCSNSAGEIPSSAVQVSSRSPSSTPFVPESSSSSSLSSISEETCANKPVFSSSSDPHIGQPVSICTSPSSSSVPAAPKVACSLTLESIPSTDNGASSDFVSKDPSTASCDSTSCQIETTDSTEVFFSSKAPSETEHVSLAKGISEVTGVRKNCNGSRPVVSHCTGAGTSNDIKNCKSSTEDASKDCPVKVDSSDTGKTKDTTGLEASDKNFEGKVLTCSSNQPMTVGYPKSQSDVSKPLESVGSDVCDNPDAKNITLVGPYREDETVRSVESTSQQKSSDSSVTLPGDEMPADGHQDKGERESCLSVSEVRIVSGSLLDSESDMEKMETTLVVGRTSEASLEEEKQDEDSSSSVSQLRKSVEEERSKENEIFTQLSAASSGNQEQHDLNYAKDDSVQSVEESKDLSNLADTNIEGEGESLKPKDSLDSKDGENQGTEKEIVPVEDTTVNDFQGKWNDDHLEKLSVGKEEIESKVDDVMKNDSAVADGGPSVTSDDNNALPKSRSGNSNLDNLSNCDEKAVANATKKDVSTEETMESSDPTALSQSGSTAELTSEPSNGEQLSESDIVQESSRKQPLEENMCNNKDEDFVESNGVSKATATPSCLTTEAQISKAADSRVQLSSSSSCMTVPTAVPLPQDEEPMDVDVISVSPAQMTSSQMSLESGETSGTDSRTQVSPPTGVHGTPPVKAKVGDEGCHRLGDKSLADSTTSQTCSSTVSSTVSTLSSPDKTAGPHLSGTTSIVSVTAPSSGPAAVSSQPTSQQSSPLPTRPVQVVKSYATASMASTVCTVSSASTVSAPSVVSTASTVATGLTGAVTSSSSITTQPVISSVPSVNTGVVRTSPQVVVAGGSPLVSAAQTTITKSSVASAATTALQTAVKIIPTQKTPVTTRLQGQTTQYIPIGPKPILPSPRPPVQSTGAQGSNVVRVSVQGTSLGQSAVAPVKSIAALVASLPASGATIGPSQLIRLVTPDGKSITLQGSQLAAIAQQAGTPMGLAVPKSITVQVSGAAVQHSPVTNVQKTVGAATPGATITVQRPQQQAAQVKPQIVVKPKAVAKPIKEEKFPSLEPLIKDPRALLNRRLAKWPLRHSVKSVFALQKYDLKRLGRKAGMKEVSGYMYSSRAVGVNWPAGIPRPSFKVAWRFRTQSLKTLGGAGLQLRILHSCLKWDEMNVRPPRGNSNTVYTSSGEIHLPVCVVNPYKTQAC